MKKRTTHDRPIGNKFISQQERDLFRCNVRHVKKISKSNRTEQQTSLPKFKPSSKPSLSNRKIKGSNNKVNYPSLSLNPTCLTTSESILSYTASGLSFKDFKKLKRGYWKCESTLDLHGSSLDIARDQLLQFIHLASTQRKKCIKIIHGKCSLKRSPPILKSAVNQWLKEHPSVLGFCSAQPQHGGAGAVYVLLRNKSR